MASLLLTVPKAIRIRACGQAKPDILFLARASVHSRIFCRP
jgi:hypothetical protein